MPNVENIEVSQTLGNLPHIGQSMSGSIHQSESGRVALRLIKKAAINGLSEA